VWGKITDSLAPVAGAKEAVGLAEEGGLEGGQNR